MSNKQALNDGFNVVKWLEMLKIEVQNAQNGNKVPIIVGG
jgi:tRNA A37 N6-isopentenylltransferase MiaA